MCRESCGSASRNGDFVPAKICVQSKRFKPEKFKAPEVSEVLQVLEPGEPGAAAPTSPLDEYSHRSGRTHACKVDKVPLDTTSKFPNLSQV